MVAKILVVDDEPNILYLLRIILRSEGYHVITTTDGPNALDLVEKEKPDLLILDILMPGMGGWEVCAHLRENPATATLPIIILSSITPGQEELSKVEKFHLHSYVAKPFEPIYLLGRVKEIFPSPVKPPVALQPPKAPGILHSAPRASPGSRAAEPLAPRGGRSSMPEEGLTATGAESGASWRRFAAHGAESERESQVLVLGDGVTAVAAAIAAKRRGSSVILLSEGEISDSVDLPPYFPFSLSPLGVAGDLLEDLPFAEAPLPLPPTHTPLHRVYHPGDLISRVTRMLLDEKITVRERRILLEGGRERWGGVLRVESERMGKERYFFQIIVDATPDGRAALSLGARPAPRERSEGSLCLHCTGTRDRSVRTVAQETLTEVASRISEILKGGEGLKMINRVNPPCLYPLPHPEELLIDVTFSFHPLMEMEEPPFLFHTMATRLLKEMRERVPGFSHASLLRAHGKILPALVAEREASFPASQMEAMHPTGGTPSPLSEAIPLSFMFPKGTEGVVLASTEDLLSPSLALQIMLGEAAGTAAALSATTGQPLHSLSLASTRSSFP